MGRRDRDSKMNGLDDVWGRQDTASTTGYVLSYATHY